MNRLRQKARLCTEAHPGGLARQQPPQRRRHQHRQPDQQGAGRDGQQKEQAQRRPAACDSESKMFQVCASIQSINMKAGKVGRKNSTDTMMAVAAEKSAIVQRARERRCADAAAVFPPRRPVGSRRALPDFAVGNSAARRQRRLPAKPRPFPQRRAFFQDRVRIHHRIPLQPDRADDQLAAFDAGVFNVDKRADAHAVLDCSAVRARPA